jgi:hypothetical protein
MTATSEKDEQYATLPDAQRLRHTAQRADRQNNCPNRNRELVHRPEEERRETQHHDRQPELD